ncbi:hypothetical protein WA026_014621 [Henosepilachna vigintioctopunctata]|uniref:Uncharacterized protein n=1 Tax=Henosepilachna vigintioctopunctata TaxID=420089 RepID=A0AAW1VGR3_9CUCU
MKNKMSKATSSPLDPAVLGRAKKILNYNNTCMEEEGNEMFDMPPGHILRKSTPCISPINSFSPKNADIAFKKPIVPPKRGIEKAFVSPGDNIVTKRSVRLSMKHTSTLNESEVEADIEKSIVSSNKNIVQRRSARLSVRQPIISDEYSSSNTHKTIRKSRQLTNMQKEIPIEYK